jgi:hypothetical protein
MITKTKHRDPYPAILPSNPSNSQKGKIIIITGASGGIGAVSSSFSPHLFLQIPHSDQLQAAAKVWAEAGANGIVIAARRLPALEKVAEQLRAICPETTVLPVKADISSVEEVDNLYKKIQQTFGRPADVLLNNAGYLRDDELIGETPVEEWWKGIVSPPFSLRMRILLILKSRKLTSKAATL